MTTAYLRFPHLHGDLVAFTAADDVWVGPVAGGRAWRLTSDHEPVRTPRFSPDGAHLAYVSFRDGHPEVMVLDLASGEARRLTYWGAKTTLVLGWTADGRVMAASHAGEANFRHVVVKAISLDGAVERLPWGPAWGVAVHSAGAVALATPGSRPPAHWKRYRGGTAPRLWLDREGDGSWERLLPEEPAALVDPMWLGDSLAFVSDRAARFPDAADEQANLWLWDTPGQGEPRQLTHQDAQSGYVRDASTDGQRVVWHSRGALWLLDSVDAEPRRLELDLPGTLPTRHTVEPTHNLDALVPDHGGDASLASWRGNAFWLSHREGPARALVADSSVRVREATLLGRTGLAVMATDAEGEDALEIRAVDGSGEPRRVAHGQLGRVLHLASTPAGDQVAVVSHDGRVSLVTVDDGSVRELGHSPEGEAETPSFSPDARYLVWSQPTGDEGTLHQVMVADLHGAGTPVALTSGKYHDREPVITRDGRHVAFLSDRTFDPSYDTQEFALSFAGSTRPWLIPLAATEPAPFGPSADGWRISKPAADKGGSAGTGSAAGGDSSGSSSTGDASDPRRWRRERPHLSPRPSWTPTEPRSGSCRSRCPPATTATCWPPRTACSGCGEAGEAGVLGSRRAGVTGDPAADELEFWSFEQRKVTTIAEKVDSYAVSGDGERVVVRHKDEVTVQPADHKPEDDDDSEKVSVDLKRLRFEVDPMAEWHQMFDENARIMRDHFWREDMDGVDWDGVVARWRPVVSQVRTHDDLVDLLWETVGELNTSHAYVTPAEPLGDQDRRLGLLGADLSPAEGGWRIDRILPGESSDPDARSPLRAAGVDARPGDLVVAVDGSPVDATYGPLASLIGAAGKPVELTLRRDGADRRVVVVPIADEEVLRYQDWVASRRAYVAEHGGGRLGYVHVPDMMSSGWAQLHRDLRIATRAEGLVADVRYNRGGHTSQLVLARLSAKVVGWGVGRHYARSSSYPSQAPRGPVVLVANENSGSDGDIVNAAGQAMGLGPVVGVRTWGGVVGIDGRFDLVDGTGITQPRYATWLDGKGYGVENYGVDPDIEVVHSPADFTQGRDRQLDRAIEEALRLLAEHPAAAPPALPEPKVRRS